MEGINTPCDQVISSKVKFSTDSTDLDLLARALKRMGYTARGNAFHDSHGNSIEFRDGELIKNMRYDAKFDENELMTEYGREVVMEAANEYGWTINDLGNNQYEYVKGYE